MALQQIPDRPDAGLEPSSRALVEKLDELLVDCTPKEIEDPIHGVEYMVGLEELKKVSLYTSSIFAVQSFQELLVRYSRKANHKICS